MRKTRMRTKSASEGPESKSKPRLVNANNLRRRLDLTGLTSQEEEAFYAGAKFDTVPALDVIPVPPMKWIMREGPRSQSSPSSPITVSNAGKASSCSLSPSPSPSHPIKLDIDSLFGTKKETGFGDSELGRLLQSASVPDRKWMESPSMISATKSGSASPSGMVPPAAIQPKILKPTLSVLEPRKKSSGISGQDLMELLKLESPRRQTQPSRSSPANKLPSTSCHYELNDDSVNPQYNNNNLTNHLKSILKVPIPV